MLKNSKLLLENAYFQVLEENLKRKSADMPAFHKRKLTSLMSTGNRSDVHTQDRGMVQPERMESKGNSSLTEILKPFL